MIAVTHMRNTLFSFALLLGIFLFAPTAYAATIYINSATGNDTTGSGTVGAPYATFHKGYTMASANDTLDLSGTFDWSNAAETGDVAGSGYTLAKNLTIQGQGQSLTFIQASSTANTADRSVFRNNATVTLKNITIRYGVSIATESGGGITNSGTLTIQNSTISYNNFNSTTNYYGAAAIDLPNNANATLIIATSTIAHNTYNGKYYGSGGVYAGQSNTITINDSTFANNIASSSNPTTFAYSYAEPSGAIGVFRFVSTVITNSTFSNNSTNAYGGAMQVYYPNWFKITNSTIANNTAGGGAGGILFESVSAGYNLSLKNTILANNSSSTPDDIYVVSGSAGMVVDNGYNIVEYSTNKTWSATGDITGNQASLNVSATLADNSALNGVQTLALSSGSVAIDAGDTTANSGIAIPLYDQRGGTRSGSTDIGSFEYGAGGFADVVPPTVSLTAPSSSGVVGGTSVTLTASASDNISIGGVSFYVDGTLQGSEDTTSTYGVTWDSTATSSGAHSAFAVARDASNNYATSTIVSFTVDNTAPIVSVTAPTPSSTVNGTTTLVATASDAVSSVSGVSFYVDGALQGSEDTSSPFNIDWNTTGTTTGTHSVFAVARDAAGNIATSSSVSFTVDNTPPTPAPVVVGSASVACSDGADNDNDGRADYPRDLGCDSSSDNDESNDPVIAPALAIPIPPVATSTISTASTTKEEIVTRLPEVNIVHVVAVPSSVPASAPQGSHVRVMFVRDLYRGVTHSDVRALQIFLNTNGFALQSTLYGTPGHETDFFGEATQDAVRRFQEAHNIKPTRGYFGPLTRAVLNNI
ncbi:MAG: hypothetical protein A2494_01545 [Candidatus Lloydbacteria bacterium RIFOXYC12_FULL_46_25]|uniref:Peptidoglycan binding-like domain-containing protein n=1 Tax=Candidatus Lloydbacteria bacterium RIFOXYC12_FULL_46_25 TaxID=1798670 RepID=A0A1G2E225_9BACT|nr:MAG: hypothetical protein A2494_01545 [Candidatus Lloydbacteria bacterium RIFOXYC12_FULL_46_25]